MAVFNNFWTDLLFPLMKLNEIARGTQTKATKYQAEWSVNIRATENSSGRQSLIVGFMDMVHGVI